MRRTKIVATIGPASREPEVLLQLVEAGMDVARLNYSHGSLDEHAETAQRVRDASSRAGHPVAILQDLPGPKLRIGALKDGVAELNPGDSVTFDCGSETVGDASRMSVTWKGLADALEPNEILYLADGSIRLRVRATRPGDHELDAVVEVGGLVASRQGLNIPGPAVGLPAVPEEDLALLAHGESIGVDLVALSFVRSASDIEFVREYTRLPLIAKVEKPQAVDNAYEVIRAADCVMVARGDLGIELPIEQVPLVQKRLLALAGELARPSITATQMLESMTFSSKPTRAEVTDVANAILDGTDAVMLSGETARGQFPTESVRTMSDIAREVEKNYPHVTLRERRLAGMSPTVATSIAEAATRAADELFIPFIATGTTTGHTAHHIAAFRPRARIIALTPIPEVARQLALLWGTEALLIERYSSFDMLLYMTEQRMTQAGIVRSKDLIAFTTGMPVGAGGTNLLKIHEIP